MRVAAISDAHIGSDEAQKSRVLDFVQNELPQLSVDKFIMAGDIFDFWGTDIDTVLSNNSELLHTMDEMGDKLVLLGGNHDWILTDTSISGLSLEAQNDYHFQSGDRNFRAIHGQQFDPICLSARRNKRLCLANSNRVTKLYNFYDDFSSGTYGKLKEMTPDTKYNDRLYRVENRVRKGNSEYVMWGHSHVSKITDDFVNLGSWTEASPGGAFIGSEEGDMYTVIDDGKVELREY